MPHDFQLDFALLADSAQINGGKTYILGGGVSVFWVQRLPVPMPVVLVMQFSFPSSQANSVHQLRVELIDSDGNAVFPPLEAIVPVAPASPGMPDDLPLNVSAVVPFPPIPALQRPGAYDVNIMFDSVQVKSLAFHVVRGAPPQPLG